MLESSQNLAAFAKKTIDPHLLKKSMKDQTVGVVFVCGGADGMDGTMRQGRVFQFILVVSTKGESILTNGEKIFVFRHVCLSAFVFCLVYLRFLSQGSNKNWKHRRQRDGWDLLLHANFRKIHCDVFFSMDFFWLEKYRTLKYSQPLQNTLLLRLTQSNTRQN